MKIALVLSLAIMTALSGAVYSSQNDFDIQLHIKGKVHYLKKNVTAWFDSNGELHSQSDFDKLYKRHTEMLDDIGCPNLEIDRKGISNARTLIIEDSSFSRSGSELNEINLKGLKLQCSHFNKSNFAGMDLAGTTFYYSKMRKANFSNANMQAADLSDTDLSGAFLDGANLEAVNLGGADLSNAIFQGANVKGLIYEPKTHPVIGTLASATNLGYLTYERSPQRLYELKQEFKERGYKQADKRITAALRRHDASFIEYVLFDITTEYGANWKRPLLIVLIAYFTFAIYYALLFLFNDKLNSKVYLVLRRTPGHKGLHNGDRLYSRKLNFKNSANKTRYLFSVYMGFLISLLSMLRIGFRDLDFGKWIKLIQKREHDLYLRGQVRLLAGVQSVASIYFLGLSVVCFFGSPFEY